MHFPSALDIGEADVPIPGCSHAVARSMAKRQQNHLGPGLRTLARPTKIKGLALETGRRPAAKNRDTSCGPQQSTSASEGLAP